MKNIVLFLLIGATLMMAQHKRAINVDDLWKMKRIGNADLSPIGDKIVFSATAYSMDENKGNSDVYVVNTDGTGLTAIQTSDANESSPKFSPDGSRIIFEKGGQLWICNADGSNSKQLTALYTGASGAVWSPTGKHILFVSEVYPECTTQECNKQRDEQVAGNKATGQIFTELMYRHWDNWRGEKRSHLFLYELESGNFFDLTSGSSSDVPPIALGGVRDYTFSPEGTEVAFVTNLDPVLATSTNNDVFVVSVSNSVAGVAPEKTKISSSEGSDVNPVYSNNGKYIAFLSMDRKGFEADKKRIMLYDRLTKTTKDISSGFDLSAEEIVWSSDSRYIYFNAADQVAESIFSLKIESEELKPLLKTGTSSGLMAASSGSFLYFKHQQSTLPYELFSLSTSGGQANQITELNKPILSQLEMNGIETFWSKGAGGTKVQSILVKPPFFDPAKKYPMIFLIHGGPQGHWNDEFHYRWNLQMFASQGYVVVAPNPRGSTGYGQRFTDEISGDWGGKVYTDLMNAYDYAIKNYTYIDSKNTFAAGASYGGYMINWIAGHTNRFNALVSHAGVFNLESMFGTTEEMWFPIWENKGTPWTNRSLYEKFSPHRYIHKCKTPMLVVHGAKDFRVPEEQAFQLFTSLQIIGVPSKFLYFPDETHFVAKAQNARLWWSTVFDWFHTHKK